MTVMESERMNMQKKECFPACQQFTDASDAIGHRATCGVSSRTEVESADDCRFDWSLLLAEFPTQQLMIPLCSDRTRTRVLPADVSSQDRRGAEKQPPTINPPATGRKHKKNNYPASRRILESVSFGELLTSARGNICSYLPPPLEPAPAVSVVYCVHFSGTDTGRW